jgi:transcriptional regulator with XRE-family HTH domain
MFAQPVQAFLKNKVQNDNLSTIELSKKVGISVSLTSELLNAHKPYPSLSTIIKIANAFNSPIEEVLGKTVKIQKPGLFAMITEDTAMNNLKKYIYTHINVSKEFASSVGIGINTLKNFLNEEHSKQSLSTSVVLRLSEHLNTTIDEMIGRTLTIQKKTVIHTTPEPVAGITNPEDINTLKRIRNSFSQKIMTETSNSSSLEPIKNDKLVSHVQRLAKKTSSKDNNRQK